MVPVAPSIPMRTKKVRIFPSHKIQNGTDPSEKKQVNAKKTLVVCNENSIKELEKHNTTPQKQHPILLI